MSGIVTTQCPAQVYPEAGFLDISLASNRIDYYRMPGPEPSAPVEAVRDPYRVLARRMRPDLPGNPSTTGSISLTNSANQAIVPRPVPVEFTNDATPAVRTVPTGSEAMGPHHESMGDGVTTVGQLVDVLA